MKERRRKAREDRRTLSFEPTHVCLFVSADRSGPYGTVLSMATISHETSSSLIVKNQPHTKNPSEAIIMPQFDFRSSVNKRIRKKQLKHVTLLPPPHPPPPPPADNNLPDDDVNGHDHSNLQRVRNMTLTSTRHRGVSTVRA